VRCGNKRQPQDRQNESVGLYNRLHVEVACRRCRLVLQRSLQFEYGECYLYDYRVGDEVDWGTGEARVLNRA